DGAFPAIVVCPASLKLNWEREAARWLPHRTRAIVSGRGTVAPRADLVIVNYEIVADHRQALAARRPRALVLDESHYCKNPRAKRLAQLNALKRLAARGKLAAAVGWIHDFLASDEPLIVFSHHAEVQEALLARFRDAGHLLGRDTQAARDATVRAFQDGSGHP